MNSFFRGLLIKIFLLITSLLLVFIMLELSLRVYHLYKYERPFFSLKGRKLPVYLDNKLGWRTTEGFWEERGKKDASGNKYHIKIKTNENGFRHYVNLNSNKQRVLIIGDSFTQAMDISNDKTYYGNLADKLRDYEFFTYGCFGYGTLQEFMILDEIIDIIKPQMLIIQQCSNDFINNDYFLEKESFINNNAMRRPYMDLKGNIYYKNPTHFNIFPDSFISHSRLSNFINQRLSMLLAREFSEKSVETSIERIGNQHPGFKRSAAITRKVMDLIRNRVAGIKVFTFCVDDLQPYYSELKMISQDEGFIFIDGIPQSIRKYEQNGFVTRSEDKGHWNELGHQIAAEKLQEFLERY